MDGDGAVRVHERGDLVFLDAQQMELTDNLERRWVVQPDGSLQNEQGDILPAVASERMYWFAWSSTHQSTELFGYIDRRGEVNGPINLTAGEGVQGDDGTTVLDVDPGFGNGLQLLDEDGNPIEGGATVTPLSN